MDRGPDFVGIGSQRCGTTWVAERLREHPQVYMVPQKEISFWCRYFHKGYDWYNAHFEDKGDRVAGEITPYYILTPRPDCALLQHYPRWSPRTFIRQLFRPDRPARDGIKQTYPNCKVFAVFRNPVDRAWSQYWMWVETRKKRGKSRRIVSFEKMFCDNGRWIQLWGRYATLLKYWRRAFPSMGVFLYDDLNADPKAFIASIYRFLDVDDAFVGNIGRRENARQYERMDEATRHTILEFYRDEMQEFFRLIGRELPWLE